LAVPQPEPQMDMMPMGGADMGMPMDGGMAGNAGMDIGQDTMMGGMPEENYGADFDAGVNADEATDPKKYIQQLTGKLSQSLRNYTKDLPSPDADLNKYVAGMIIKQTVDGLSQDDVTEILNKVKSDEQPGEPTQNDAMMNGVDNGEQSPNGVQDPSQMMPQGANESVKRFGFDIDELVINDIDKENVEKDTQHQIKRIGSFKRSPFVSPSFD